MDETLTLTKEQTEIVLSKFASEKNGFHQLMQMMLNSLMMSERKAFLEGLEENKANGYRDLSVMGNGMMLELRIPRDRLSQFSPVILALYRSQEEHYKEIVFELYSHGLTTRDISVVMDKIYGDHYSKSKISTISQGFYQQMEAWRNRPLEKYYKALFIDGTFVMVMRNGIYRNECYYIVLGLRQDNTREIISITDFPTESSTSWELIFDTLKERGLEKVGIFVSDDLTSIGRAIVKKFPGSAHQKCCVHLMRNLMTHVRHEEKSAIATDFKYVIDIMNPTHTIAEALKRYNDMTVKWSNKYKGLSKYFNKLDIMPYLTCLQYDSRVRSMLYTTNWIERFNRKVKRTLKIRGAMPSSESVLALITSVAIDTTEGCYRYPIHNFNNEDKL